MLDMCYMLMNVLGRIWFHTRVRRVIRVIRIIIVIHINSVTIQVIRIIQVTLFISVNKATRVSSDSRLESF